MAGGKPYAVLRLSPDGPGDRCGLGGVLRRISDAEKTRWGILTMSRSKKRGSSQLRWWMFCPSSRCEERPSSATQPLSHSATQPLSHSGQP